MKRFTFALILGLTVIAGCKKKFNDDNSNVISGDFVPVISLTLDIHENTVDINSSFTLTATILPENATYNTASWTSSDSNIASVDGNGKVTGKSTGSCTITASAGTESDECIVHVIPKGAVDLGCSVYWRTRNIGATKESDAGEFYAWGETEPKSQYLRDYYNNWGGSDYRYKNLYDNDVINDAAAKLPGGTWRMPTKAEVEELISKCNVREGTVNGKTCFIVSKANSDINIVLPKCGVSNSESTYYWCSTFGSNRPDAMLLTKTGSTPKLQLSSYDGWCGLPIRPVADK